MKFFTSPKDVVHWVRTKNRTWNEASGKITQMVGESPDLQQVVKKIFESGDMAAGNDLFRMLTTKDLTEETLMAQAKTNKTIAVCPQCGEDIWDVSTVDQRLNKCWKCGLRCDEPETRTAMTKIAQEDPATEWAKNLAENHAKGIIDVYAGLLNACDSLGVDTDQMDSRYNQYDTQALQDWRTIYFILTGNKAKEVLGSSGKNQGMNKPLTKQAFYMVDPVPFTMRTRICPKLRPSTGQLVSTAICREKCLDGIYFDDDPDGVYCAETLFRKHIIDKFSREWMDKKTGEWVGGYINSRFHVFPTAGTPANPDVERTQGNKMQLALDERSRVARPHEYSTERRLQEQREPGSTKSLTLKTMDDTTIKKSASGLQKMAIVQGISHQIMPNGDLKITADEQGKAELQEMKNERPDFDSDAVMYDVLETVVANSELNWIQPEWVGALTDAPMLGVLSQERPLKIGEDAYRRSLAGHWDDKTWVQDVTKAWAFMDYQVRSVQQDLLEKGEAIFQSGNDEETMKREEQNFGVDEDAAGIKHASVVLRKQAATSGVIKIAATRLPAEKLIIAKAFSQAIDLHNKGVPQDLAAAKISNDNRITSEQAVTIQAAALRKLAKYATSVFGMTKQAQVQVWQTSRPITFGTQSIPAGTALMEMGNGMVGVFRTPDEALANGQPEQQLRMDLNPLRNDGSVEEFQQVQQGASDVGLTQPENAATERGVNSGGSAVAPVAK